jgi:hypothetical protein
MGAVKNHYHDELEHQRAVADDLISDQDWFARWDSVLEDAYHPFGNNFMEQRALLNRTRLEMRDFVARLEPPESTREAALSNKRAASNQ